MRVHRLPRRPSAILFDIDGTLYTNAAYMEAQNEALIGRFASERGKSLEEARTLVRGAKILAAGAAGQSSLANALAYLGIPIETSVAWRRELLSPESWLSRDERLRAALLELSRSSRLAALTNNPSDIGRRGLAALGVGDLFPTVFGLDDTLKSKPDPEPFRLALDALDLPPEEILAVGDRFDVDLAVPLSMGMGAIQVDGVEDVYRLPELLRQGGDRRGGEDRGGTAPLRTVAPASLPAAAPPERAASPEARKRGESLRLLKVLPTLLVVAIIATSMVTWRNTDYEMSLMDDAIDRLDAVTVLSAIHDAYPELVSKPRKGADGEWEITARGKTFAWAHGRILPPELGGSWASYRPYIDSVYPWQVPDPREYPSDLVARLKTLPDRQGEEPGNEGGFVAALYGGMDEDSVWDQQVRVTFLGKRLTVHRLAADALSRVEEEIRREAKYSSAVRRFISALGEVGGYHWRTILGRKDLSYHSFGIAIDLLPQGYSRRGIYWQWESEANEDWATLPLDKRWSPPEEVIRAFEDNGFTWGGKWLEYDDMHFEYRPELILLRQSVLPWYLSLKG